MEENCRCVVSKKQNVGGNIMTEIRDKVINLRHELHAHPELSCQEEWTRTHLMQFVKENTKLEVVDRGRWFYVHAQVPSEHADRGPIAFRADFDALPMDEGITLPHGSKCNGVAHKCGHDGHAAALAGLALMLDQAQVGKGALRDIYLIFQYGEEIGAGGEECSSLIEEKGIAEVYACHNWSGLRRGEVYTRVGACQCASFGLTVKFEGSPAHASQPEDGHNPSAAISRLALETEKLAADLAKQAGSLVLATIVNIVVGHKNFGMSAYDGEISITLRAEEEPRIDQLEAGIKAFAEEMAGQYGLTVSFEKCDVFPETSSSKMGVDRIFQAAEKAGLTAHELPKAYRASEDFGYYLKKCQGGIFYIGNGEDYPAIHTHEFDFVDENLEKIGSLFMALI